ncbi:MAG: tetratricopeptide repeat protein [Proteobacteria bacterium]|nr:tetratricopeptide repeat protein [Pseudomonadota bacterium]
MLRENFALKSLFIIMIVTLFALPMGCGKSEEAAPKSQSAVKESTGKQVWIERWAQDRPMTLKRAGLSAVAHNGYIYAIGGGDFTGEGLNIFDSVEYTKVNADGTLGEWKESGPLTMPRVYTVALIYNDYIYVMGGESKDAIYTGEEGNEPPTLLHSVERAKINADGTLGKWILEPEEMSFARRGGEVFAYNGYLYAAGGFNGAGLNDVEKAKINDDGSLGKWSREDELINEVRYISGYMQKDDKLYVIGGHVNSAERATGSIEMATIQSDSTTSAWKDVAPLYTNRFLNTAIIVGNTAYTFGGHNTINLAATDRTTFNEDGTLTAWEPDTPINIARRAAVAVEVNNVIYVIGGMIRPMAVSVSIDSVETAVIEPGKKLGNWIEDSGHAYAIYQQWKDEISVDVRNHMLHGRAYLKNKKYKTALFDASEALKVKPGFYAAYNLRADVYYRMGEKDKAIEALKNSLESKEDNLEALVGLGYIYVEKGDHLKGVSYYKSAVKAHPDSVIAHYNLGQTYLVIDEYEKANKEFEWMLEKDPDSTEAKHLLEMSNKHIEKLKGNK